MQPIPGSRLTGKPTLHDLLQALAPWESDLVSNPRSLHYVPPPAKNIEFRLGQGVGDLDRYLFGANVPWRIIRPPTVTENEWEVVSKAVSTFSWSTLSPYDFVVRIHHLFIEVALPILLLRHLSSCTYSQTPLFAQRMGLALSTKFNAQQRLLDYELEQLLDQSGSGKAFSRDPAVLLNRLRIIRNNVIHADPSVGKTGGVERWGGIYLRYFEALLEELRLVKVGSSSV